MNSIIESDEMEEKNQLNLIEMWKSGHNISKRQRNLLDSGVV